MKPFDQLATDSFAILASAGVNFDDVAGLDESGHNELGTGLDGRWLGHVSRGIALGTRRTLGDFQFNHGWWINDDGV